MIKNNNYLDSLSKSLLNDVRDVMENKKCSNKECKCKKCEAEEKGEVKEAKKMKGEDPCWKDYKMVGTKKGKGGKEVPNCVPEETEIKEGEEKGGGYNATAVDKSIKSSRPKIGGKEAKMIHALLKGRTPKNEEVEIVEEAPMYNVTHPKHGIIGVHSAGRGFVPSKPHLGFQAGKTIPDGSKIDRSSEVGKNKRIQVSGTKLSPVKNEEVEIDEAKAKSPIAGTRLISKHEGQGGHHAEVRFSPDWNEYSVHHYSNGKHMGEGPVSYHGEGKEGREDATNTAEHEVNNYRPKNGKLHQVKEEVQIDETSHKTRSSWLSKTFDNHFKHRVDDSTAASGWRIDPPLKGPMPDSRLKIYKIASDKVQKQNTKDYEDRERKKREEYTPKVHDLRHMDHGEVYDHTQTSDEVKDGDVMRVKNGTAALIGAWPTMIHGKSDVLHSFKPGTSIKTIDDGTYHKTADLADRTHGIKEEVEVVDNEFNRQNYKDLIGKKFPKSKIPSYARVKEVSKTTKEEVELDEKLIGKQHKIDKNKNGKLDAQDFKMLRKEETIEEKLDPSMGASKYVQDFVKSKDPRFEGKTKAERIKMALGAYYGAKNEEVEHIEESYGKKRDYKKHHLYVDGKYVATTTWARNAKEAEKRFVEQHPEHKNAKVTVVKER